MKNNLNKHIEQKINETLGLNEVFNWQTVGGGSINETYKVSSKNTSFFIKTNTLSIFKNGFKEEVLGLQFLKKNSAIVPKIIVEEIFENQAFLVLEWIEEGIKTTKFWKNFGEQLAALHQQKGVYFGLDYPNFMGQLHQKNTLKNNFIHFFIENRLRPQLKLAFNSNLISTEILTKFESLYSQLGSIIPEEKPSALHGDLWSGNFICNLREKAVFIDPAVYYGHREIDLAMTTLFGGFTREFYICYEAAYPLEKGFEARKDIYNLYPLLIHLNLFGVSYLNSIKAIISKF